VRLLIKSSGDDIAQGDRNAKPEGYKQRCVCEKKKGESRRRTQERGARGVIKWGEGIDMPFLPFLPGLSADCVVETSGGAHASAMLAVQLKKKQKTPRPSLTSCQQIARSSQNDKIR
jgi:hypothetical protein